MGHFLFLLFFKGKTFTQPPSHAGRLLGGWTVHFASQKRRNRRTETKGTQLAPGRGHIWTWVCPFLKVYAFLPPHTGSFLVVGWLNSWWEMLFHTPGPLPESKNVRWNLGRPLTPPLYRWGHRGLELWSHFPMPFKLASCKARNKNHILCLWGSTLSLLLPYLWVESFQSSSSCFSPLLNNMLEHPKADSIWEALVTAGHKHQRSQSKSFQHSLLSPWSVSQEHMPFPRTA